MATGAMERLAQTEPRSGKYLTFALGREEFAVQALNVREILGMQRVTALPQTPAYIKGVMNLRGKLIPVIDLRLKFGFAEQEQTPRTCIVVVQFEQANTRLLAGVVVDEVAEVVTLQAADIEDAPDFGEGVSSPYILGMAKTRGKVRILLDIAKVISAQEIHGLAGIAL